MKKFLTVVILLNLMMAFGLAGFLLATGRLDKQKMGTILDLLRHRGSPEGLRTQVAGILEPGPATAPATQHEEPTTRSLAAASTTAAASASDRIAYAQQAIEQERLRLEREAQDLLQRQKLLETQRQEFDARQTQFDDLKKAYEAEVAATKTRLQKESFTRTLSLYGELKPRQVKEIFQGLEPQTVVDYLQAMDSEQATRIIAEFKTPAERKFIGQILERMRTPGMGPANNSTGGASAGTTMPAPAGQARN